MSEITPNDASLFRFGDLEYTTVAIPINGSLSDEINTRNHSFLGLIMSAGWTAADLTIEVSVNGSDWYGVVRDFAGTQVNVIAGPVAGAWYGAANLASLISAQWIRIRSGTEALPVNQAEARSLTVITRPLA